MTTPRISVVTSSYNQGQYIGRTIDSVLAQDYPDLEHIVVDGLSSDDTVDVLSRYPHLTVIREKDTGQANAINKGFRRATGDILCFLNSDDTFEPGALLRVAKEIDPAAGRHVVMGRCRFIDEHDRFTGVEHPSAFESHERVLAIWKGYTIPQPAVFWTREVWDTCGALDEQDHLVLDYDLFCRFSRKYPFHTFDQVVANYRLHEASKTQGMDDAKRLRQAVQVSRKYWPSALTPTGIALRASWASYQFDRRGRAYKHLVGARAAWRRGAWGSAVAALVPGAVLAPEVALAGLAAPFARRGGRVARYLAGMTAGAAAGQPQTAAWRDFAQVHADGWAGPTVRIAFARGDDPREALILAGDAPLPLPAPLSLAVRVPGRAPIQVPVTADQPFRIELPVGSLPSGRHEVEISASAFVVPHDLWGNGDHRPLSYRLQECRVHVPGVSEGGVTA
jgi:glycosyltransferase involved in cell wall biosynthesis